ncbi:Cell cycle serine/threonine-protein kinase cdc5/MSD2, partial [Entophlyctis luteolus]
MNHNAIVAFNCVFEDDDNVYIILELCENGTMAELLKVRRRLTEPEVRFYMYHLLQAVSYMHNHHVIHRDLKLGNMFLSRNMRLKIGDFGLAALITHDGERKRTICGTPNYIAPEVLFGAGSGGHSFEVDLWSLGVVMFTMLVGKPPFQTKEVKAIYKKIRDNSYEFPPASMVSETAQSVVNALLSNNPALRPSVEEVLCHPFFLEQPVPRSIPVSALVRPPLPGDLTMTATTNIAPMPAISSSETVTTAINVPESSSSIVKSTGQQDLATELAAAIARPTTDTETGTKMSPLKDSTPVRINGNAGNNANTVAPLPPSPPASTAVHLGGMTPPAKRVFTGGIAGASDAVTVAAASAVKSMFSAAALRIGSGNSAVPGGGGFVIVNRADSGSGTSDSDRVTEMRQKAMKGPLDAVTLVVEQPDALECRTNLPDGRNNEKLAAVRNIPAANSSPRNRKEQPHPKESTLEAMCTNIQNAFSVASENGNGGEARRTRNMYAQDEQPLEPDTYIVKWIDYSNKYGLGYQLMDGSIGVYFNDSTSILVSADGIHVEYLFYEPLENGTTAPKMHRRAFTVDSYPPDLKKKMTLLHHFGGYMKENLYKINFFDHTKLILSQNAKVVTYIDKNRQTTTRRIGDFLGVGGNKEVIDRVAYAKDTIQQMIAKKKKKLAEASAGAPPTKARPGRKPTNAPPATARQAQVRAAQKAFIERKKQHVETLEAKVASLESRLTAVETENTVLRGLLMPASASSESLVPGQHERLAQFQPPMLPVSNLSGSGFDVSLSWEQISQLLQSLTVQNSIVPPAPIAPPAPMAMDLNLGLNNLVSSVQTSAPRTVGFTSASVDNMQEAIQEAMIPTDPFDFIVSQQPIQIQSVVAQQQQQLLQTLAFSPIFSVPFVPPVASFNSNLNAVPALASSSVSPPATSPEPSSNVVQQQQLHDPSHTHCAGRRGRGPQAFASKLTFRVNFVQSSLKSVPSLRREEAETQIDRMMSLVFLFKTTQFNISHTGHPAPQQADESQNFLQTQFFHENTEFKPDCMNQDNSIEHGHRTEDSTHRRHRPHHFYGFLDVHDHEAWAREFPDTLGVIWNEMQELRGGLLRICDEQDGQSVLSILDRRHHRT